MSRICSKCKAEKPNKDFHKVGRGNEIRHDCKQCRSKQKKIYNQIPYVRKRNKEYAEMWREQHPDTRSDYWRGEKPEKTIEKRKWWKEQDHKEVLKMRREYIRRYQEKYPEKIKEIVKERRKKDVYRSAQKRDNSL